MEKPCARGACLVNLKVLNRRDADHPRQRPTDPGATFFAHLRPLPVEPITIFTGRENVARVQYSTTVTVQYGDKVS